MAFKVRRATDDDRGRIEETLAEYLTETDAVKRYDWLYLGNPHGRALTWLAFDEEKGALAGMTSFFPRRLVVDGAMLAGALGGDGYVRPPFRRRGLGRTLHSASRADMAGAGLHVMFGTPMPANLTPLTQTGARTIGDTVRYARPLTARSLKVGGVLGDKVVTPLLNVRLGSARLEPMTPGDRRVDDVWAATRGELRIATVRDAAFYTWRFLQSPSQRQTPYVVVDRGRAVGVCALERLDNRLRIIDIVAPRRDWGRVISAILPHAAGADAVDLKLMREDGQARWIWRYGFIARDEKPLNLLLPPDEPAAPVLYDPKRWYFTWAETDMDHG